MLFGPFFFFFFLSIWTLKIHFIHVQKLTQTFENIINGYYGPTIDLQSAVGNSINEAMIIKVVNLELCIDSPAPMVLWLCHQVMGW